MLYYDVYILYIALIYNLNLCLDLNMWKYCRMISWWILMEVSASAGCFEYGRVHSSTILSWGRNSESFQNWKTSLVMSCTHFFWVLAIWLTSFNLEFKLDFECHVLATIATSWTCHLMKQVERTWKQCWHYMYSCFDWFHAGLTRGIGKKDHHFLTVCSEALWYSADKAQMVGNLISISMFHLVKMC